LLFQLQDGSSHGLFRSLSALCRRARTGAAHAKSTLLDLDCANARHFEGSSLQFTATLDASNRRAGARLGTIAPYLRYRKWKGKGDNG
jgi:hypothetical protein